MSGDWPEGIVRSGDLVVVGQGVGEPTPLLEELLVKGRSDIEVFVGLSHSKALTGDASLPLVSFGAMGPLSTHATGDVAIIPCQFDDLPRLLSLRAPGRLVILMQVAESDAQGGHSLGMAVDYTYELASQARAVVAEINAQMPVTSAPRLPASRFDAVVRTSRPLPVVTTAPSTDVHRRIAALVLPLVPNGATIQLGVGAVPSAIGTALAVRRGLALQVDLTGQVNAEEIGSGYVGGIGGQAEYLRAAQRSAGGRSIVVLPATTGGGRRSRIVGRLESGTVTTPRSGVDFIVTEFGMADLRGRSLRERAELMTGIAAPQHREGLGREVRGEQDGRG